MLNEGNEIRYTTYTLNVRSFVILFYCGSGSGTVIKWENLFVTIQNLLDHLCFRRIGPEQLPET
jgi:hypothetical protein